MIAWLQRFKDEIADAYVLGPVRVVLGALLGWQALAAAEELEQLGYFGDTFHVSMLPDALVPSHSLYSVLLALRVVLACMVMFGVWARPALASSALLGPGGETVINKHYLKAKGEIERGAGFEAVEEAANQIARAAAILKGPSAAETLLEQIRSLK